MRLTLRTLLAYLNQSNLNLRAIERIEAKVRETPAAAKLIEDLKRIASDPEIAALPPDCEEGQKDANWVAEYLDNALPDYHVESFEKLAFDSSLLLSEICGCHEILSAICRNETTLAPAVLRQRAYEIGRTPLDHASLADVSEIDYLAYAPRSMENRTSAAHQFVDDLKRAEEEFRLGPPPEESHRHDEWADAFSSEGLDIGSPDRRGWLLAAGLFGAAFVLLAFTLWLMLRATGGTG
jgi:hypothetical protein